MTDNRSRRIKSILRCNVFVIRKPLQLRFSNERVEKNVSTTSWKLLHSANRLSKGGNDTVQPIDPFVAIIGFLKAFQPFVFARDCETRISGKRTRRNRSRLEEYKLLKNLFTKKERGLARLFVPYRRRMLFRRADFNRRDEYSYRRDNLRPKAENSVARGPVRSGVRSLKNNGTRSLLRFVKNEKSPKTDAVPSGTRRVLQKGQIPRNRKLTTITFYRRVCLFDHSSCLESRSDRISEIASLIFHVSRACAPSVPSCRENNISTGKKGRTCEDVVSRFLKRRRTIRTGSDRPARVYVQNLKRKPPSVERVAVNSFRLRLCALFRSFSKALKINILIYMFFIVCTIHPE